MLGSVFQLDGDSCTMQSSIGVPLRHRLEAFSAAWTDQLDLRRLAGEAAGELHALRRVAALAPFIPGDQPAGDVVVIGRSSGARVATLLALRQPVRAVVALGYPFRRPNKADEPDRYQHLAQITTPTLILQGVHDSYGGREILEFYRFSPAVTVEFIEADHKLRLPARAWDEIATRILGFCQAAPGARGG